VKKLRQAHPNTPILLAEDSNFQNVSPTQKGVVLRAAFEKLKAEGTKNLHLLSSRGMLRTDGEGTVDGCHPSDLGMMRLADAFTKILIPIVHESELQTTVK
jgi:lysophospholipase L1-like esterase